MTTFSKKITSLQPLSSVLLLACAVIGYFVPIIAFAGILVTLIAAFRRFKIFSLIESVALSGLVVMCLHVVLYSVLTSARITLPVWHAESILLFFIILYLFFSSKTIPQTTQWKPITKSDIAAASIALFTFCILLIPIINQTGSYIAQFLSYGEDNASHYALTRYAYTHGDHAYFHDPERIGVMESLEIYPQGFHINAAIAEGLLYPYQPTEAAFVKIYSFFIALIYAIFIFWFIKLCTIGTKNVSPLLFVSLLPALTLTTSLSIFLLLLDRGFQPQVFGLTFVCATTYLLYAFDEAKKYRLQGLYLVIFLCIGIASSWWLLLPLVGILGLYYAYRNSLLKDAFKDIPRYILLKLLVITVILLPIITGILLSVKKDPLSEQGGVDKLPYIVLFYFIAPVFIALILRVISLKKLAYPLVALCASICMALFLGIYHLVRVGHFEYFYYKSLYTVLLFCIVCFFIAAFYILNKYYAKLPALYSYVIPVIIVLATIFIANKTNLIYVKVYTHNWFPGLVLPGELDPLFTPSANQYDDIIYMGDCVAPSDYLTNRWAGARFLSATATRSKMQLANIYSKPDDANRYLRSYLEKERGPVLIIIDTKCAHMYPVLSDLSKFPDAKAIYK